LKLKEKRKQLGITLSELEKRTGLRTGSISNIEQGKRNPSLNAMQKLSKALNSTISELFFNE
jgi:transcriptional regulator with XRE-family HTH domain